MKNLEIFTCHNENGTFLSLGLLGEVRRTSIALAGGTKIPGLYFGERELGDQGLLRTTQKRGV